MEHFDLIVLGAGSGGLAAAKRASSHGARVAIVEGDRIGGTCVIRGCVPKKLLVYGSQYSEYLKNASQYGVEMNTQQIDTKKLLESVRREVDRLNDFHERLLDKANIEIIRGWGYISGINSVLIKNQTGGGKPFELFAKNILIAVGGKPYRPEIPGASLGWVSDDVFLQENFPEKVVIVGAGFIACEFACILNGLGVKVQQLVRGSRLLKGFDNEISFSLEESMRMKGIDIAFESKLTCLEGVKNNITVTINSEIRSQCGAVIFATGREAALEFLDLKSVDIKVVDNKIKVNNKNATNIPNIYAIGDVSNSFNLTPVAVEEGRVLADNIFGRKNRSMSYKFIPKAVFSRPEIASVGMTEESAIDEIGEENIDIYRSKFTPMSKSIFQDKEKCLLKLIVESKTDKLLGCHMIGENAAEIIQMASIAIRMGAKKSDFDLTMSLHPTIAEEFVTMS